MGSAVAMDHSPQPNPAPTPAPLNEALSSSVQRPRIRYTTNRTASVEDVEDEDAEQPIVSIAPPLDQLAPLGALAPLLSRKGDPPRLSRDMLDDRWPSNVDSSGETAQQDQPSVPLSPRSSRVPLTSRRRSRAASPSSSPASADTTVGNPLMLGDGSKEDGRENSTRGLSSGDQTNLSTSGGEDTGIRPPPNAPSPVLPTPDTTSAPSSNLSNDPSTLQRKNVDEDDPPGTEHDLGKDVGTTRTTDVLNSQDTTDGIRADLTTSTQLSLVPPPGIASALNAQPSNSPPVFPPMDVDEDYPPAGSGHSQGRGVGSLTRRTRDDRQPTSGNKTSSTPTVRNNEHNLRRSERAKPSPSSFAKKTSTPSKKRRKGPAPARAPRPRPQSPATTSFKINLYDARPRAITEHVFIRATPLTIETGKGALVRLPHVLTYTTDLYNAAMPGWSTPCQS
jgi:hypothetical protein